MSKYRSKNFTRKRRLIIIRKISLFLILFFSIYYGLFFWLKKPIFQIQEIEITGNTFLSEKKIYDQINTNLSEKFLINSNNRLFFPRKKVRKEIISNTEVKDIKIDFEGLNKLNIDIVEFEPWGKWCDTDSEKKCYFVNNEGKMFHLIEKIFFEDTIELIFNKNENLEISQLPEKDENQFLPRDQLQKIIKFIDLLSNQDIKITQIETSDFQTIKLNTEQGPYILIKVNDNPQILISKFIALVESESIHQKQFSNLEYIDLRFTGKANYKIK